MATSSGESPPTEDLPPRRDVVAQDEAEEGIFADSPESAESTRTPGPSAGHRHPNGEKAGTAPTSLDDSAFVVEDDEIGHGGPGSSEQHAGIFSDGTGLVLSLNNAVVPADAVAAGSTAALVAEEEDEDDGDEDMHEGGVFHAEEERQADSGSTTGSTDDSSVTSSSCAVKDQAPFDGGSNESAGPDESGGESKKEESIDRRSQIIEQGMVNDIMVMLYELAQIKITYSKEELDDRDPSALLLDGSERALQLIHTLTSGHPVFMEGFNWAKECNQRQQNELEEQQQSQQMEDGDGGHTYYESDASEMHETDPSEMHQPTRLFETPSTAQGGTGLLTPTSNIKSDGNRKALVFLKTQTKVKARECDAKHRKELAERDAEIAKLQEEIAELEAVNDRGAESGQNSGISAAGITGLDVESDPKFLALQRQAGRLRRQLQNERKKVAELELLEHEKVSMIEVGFNVCFIFLSMSP